MILSVSLIEDFDRKISMISLLRKLKSRENNENYRALEIDSFVENLDWKGINKVPFFPFKNLEQNFKFLSYYFYSQYCVLISLNFFISVYYM